MFEKTTLVIPCYNEAERLDVDTFSQFVSAHPALRMIMVNDGSTDATEQMLQALAEAHAGIDAIQLDTNQGKAEAVRQGLLCAVDGGAQVTGYWDADLSTSLDELQRFAERFEESPGIHAVIGSRVKMLGRNIERRLTRHYCGRIFATCASLALQLPIYDTQCGAKMFRVMPYTRALFDKPFMSRWLFDIEILFRLKREIEAQGSTPDGVIYELPLQAWQDVAGSKLNVFDFVTAAWELAVIAMRYRSG